MKLSFEIPLPDIEEFTLYEDMQFGLAHLVLKRRILQRYVKLYQGCLLDNSMYELGNEPLSTRDLLKAAVILNPRAVIAPDWEGDALQTYDAVIELFRARPSSARWTIGAVVQGKDLAERRRAYKTLVQLECEPICFPFRSPRDETIFSLFQQEDLIGDWWYHLLGLRDVRELSWKLPGIWSMDTAKPFKGIQLSELVLRGLGRLDLTKKLSPGHQLIAYQNICYLRRLANA
jgi:hypothetical protein